MSKPVTLDAIYRQHGPSVFRRARQILGVEADAYEVVQDVFLGLVANPNQYQAQSSLTTYLYSVTTHACINRIRNQRNRDRLQNQHSAVSDSDTCRALTPEQMLVLHRAILSLPSELCQAAISYWLDGMTHEEIAQTMLCSRRHVGDLLMRATHWLSREEERSCRS